LNFGGYEKSIILKGGEGKMMKNKLSLNKKGD